MESQYDREAEKRIAETDAPCSVPAGTGDFGGRILLHGAVVCGFYFYPVKAGAAGVSDGCNVAACICACYVHSAVGIDFGDL